FGQTPLAPEHVSLTSHRPAAPRQTVPDGRSVSDGQVARTPLQVSATSQVPADERQTVAAGLTLSVGQTVVDPLHVSAGSHAPAPAARHCVPPVVKVQVDVQHEVAAPLAFGPVVPPSHASGLSTTPSPQSEK